MSDETNENANSESVIDLDALDAQIAEIESAIDQSGSKADNTGDAGTKPEEASNAFAERIDVLEADNKRLTQMISRLIMVNGARISSNENQGVEAFPSAATSVEKTFTTDPSSDTEIPALSDIKLAP